MFLKIAKLLPREIQEKLYKKSKYILFYAFNNNLGTQCYAHTPVNNVFFILGCLDLL